MTADGSGNIITDAAKSTLDVTKGQYTRFSTADNDFSSQFEQKDNLYLYIGSSVTSGLQISDGAITSVKGTASKIILCKLKTKTLTNDEVAALNDVMGVKVLTWISRLITNTLGRMIICRRLI